MLLLRILALPIALLTFAVLYSVSIKAPHLVELANLILWIIFPVVVVVARISRHTLQS